MRNPVKLLVAIGVATLVGIGGSVALPEAANAAPCTTYYISSATGSDSNDGCTTATPWQSLTKVNATTFAAGNQILFAKGGAWTGTLTPQGSGASGNPIVISSYGSGAAPILAGGGVAATIKLTNQHDWTIQNLELTNTTAVAAYRAVIHVKNDTTGILHGIHIVGNNIHDLKGFWNDTDPQPVTTSAISFELSDNNTTSGWDDILIDGNTLRKVDAGAIYIGSPIGLDHDIVTTNVVIQNNTISDSGGNSIVCVFCAAPLVQYNVVRDSGYRYSGAAIWGGWITNAVWQYNEVARNGRAFVDGQAFDIDNSMSGTLVQYNYSHDNPSGFLMFCCNATFGATGNHVVRYNISQNDGANFATFSVLSGLEPGASADIYNNTIYIPSGNNGDVTSGVPSSGAVARFSNNLIYKEGAGGYSTTRTTWTNNLMYGQHPASEPSGSGKVTTDPKLLAPGKGGDGRTTASAYQLRTGSPAIGAGTVISGNGGLDYFGNSVSATVAPNIGAYNGAGVSAPAATYGAFWRLDLGAGTAASDSAGNNNAGTLQPGASWVTGQRGPFAVGLTGASNSFVDIPTPGVDTGGSYTVQAWVKPNSLTGNQTYASIDGSVISPFYLQLSGGKFTFTVRSSDSTSSSYTQVIGATATTGQWYNLIGTYDSTSHSIKLYVDGVLQGTTAFSSAWKANGHTTLGRAKWNGAPVDFANASIDDVRMIPRAISADEAFALGTGASVYLPLDEGTGRAMGDVTGSAPQGSLQGNSSWNGSGAVGSNALALDGTLGTVAVIPVSPIETNKSFTVSSWVKVNSLSGNRTFVSMWGGYVSPFYLQLSGGKFTMVTRTGDSTSSTYALATSTTSATTGTWYHLTGVYNATAGTVSIYVNGVLEATASATTPFRAVGVAVLGAGEWNRKPVDFVDGAMDDVQFYPRTLTATEILALATP